jgi:hypothetical protein
MDLNFTIECKSIFCHDWMAFASWYSIKKSIPDSQVHVNVKLDKPLFGWTSRVGVPICRESKGFCISPTVLATRDFTGSFDVSSSKSNEQSCFVDYLEGCGNFVVDDWINTTKVPFERAFKRFKTQDLTVNEVAVLTFLESCHHLYQSVGGS